MSWNYRVIEFVEPVTGEPWRSIHEVHYHGNQPMSYSENPAHITWDVSEGEESPIGQIERFRTALNMPVLVEEDFNVAMGALR